MNPAFLNGLPSMIVLSVGVAVTSSLETNVEKRLAWLDVVLRNIDVMVLTILLIIIKIYSKLTLSVFYCIGSEYL